MKNNRAFLLVAAACVVMVFVILALWIRKNEPATAPSAPAADTAALVREHSPSKGPKDAKVTIVEFLDPECEACRAMHPIVTSLLAEYEGKVRLVIRYMPFHGNSRMAASALEEARELGKFEQALDILFEKQPEWADHHQPRPELIPVFLKQVGVDEGRLFPPSLLPKHKAKLDLDEADGRKLGVQGTPTFFVNGKMLSELGHSQLKAAIEEALKAN
jgi:protein-disulfide isomerase